MKKVKDTRKKEKQKKPTQSKEDIKLERAKITTIPSYTPGELPKR
jgi:hypothetical protein